MASLRLDETRKAALALALILSLSWLSGLMAVPSFHETETMALAQDSAKLKGLSPLETEQLYQSLTAERWYMWMETVAVFLLTVLTAVAALIKFKYWPALALVGSIYVIAVAITPMMGSGWNTLTMLVGIWPKSAGALWYFYAVPALYGVLAATAIVNVARQGRGRLGSTT
jgi:hypothetical protein